MTNTPLLDKMAKWSENWSRVTLSERREYFRSKNHMPIKVNFIIDQSIAEVTYGEGKPIEEPLTPEEIKLIKNLSARPQPTKPAPIKTYF